MYTEDWAALALMVGTVLMYAGAHWGMRLPGAKPVRTENQYLVGWLGWYLWLAGFLLLAFSPWFELPTIRVL